MKQFDVIVIGGGHAGIDAAAAAARMGVRTALVTHRFDRLGEMSCNPAIGGLGKGHLVREVDALDGLIGRIGDRAAIQYRLLNRSKGPAVQGPRSQIDRDLYRAAMQAEIAATANLTVIEGEAARFVLAANRVVGIEMADGTRIEGGAFVLTTGTFLGGVIHIGDEQTPAGRMGDPAANTMAAQLRDMGLPMGRLKTGTPPRLKSATIDWDRVGVQDADAVPEYFSTLTDRIFARQIACGVTETNAQTHDIINENLGRSAMYSGNISGTGPRYCPSIEDKVSRFADKTSHQVFLEPEGLNSPLVYPNGISTSLPRDVQRDYVRSMRGLENVEITQYGYAIEYDYIDPRALDHGLRLRAIENLYFAGQINGTTGYEEAAAQGTVATINAVLGLRGEAPLDLNRTNSYIGVLIDDLIHRGVSEPYRMFTSRAEYRLSIRADNADQRLTPIGLAAGVVGENRRGVFETKMEALDKAGQICRDISVTPNQARDLGFTVKSDGQRRNLLELLAFPSIGWTDLTPHFSEIADIDPQIATQLAIEATYANYIERQNRDIVQFEHDRKMKIPTNFDYAPIQGLSNELREKLAKIRPANIHDANKIEGITPAALTLIAAHLRKALKAS